MTTWNALDVLAVAADNAPSPALAESIRGTRQAVMHLMETQADTLRMLEAAHRALGMWVADNQRIARARMALAACKGGDA